MKYFLCAILSASILGALPSGLQVGCQAELTLSSPDAMEILVADQALLNWHQFSIETHETVTFIQPDASSLVLNRVLGDDPSRLMGSLNANGKVLLINPHGIVFGKDAKIDVGSLIASTLDLIDDQEWHFVDTHGGEIQNLGQIRTSEGDLVLLSRRIDNQGTLEALSGTVAIGAAAEVLLSPNGERRILIQPSKEKGFLDQSGRVRAADIEMQVDGNPYRLAFQHSGEIDALGIEERDGEIFLNVPTGDLFVTGSMRADGGSIALLGQRIGLMAGARLDVSGATGGGSVFIGEDDQAPLAKAIYMDPEATIYADARSHGDGGRVILWSDRSTQMLGHISARGGALGGDGGFVEVSSIDSLEFAGFVDRTAPFGEAGTLLLDPHNVTIVAGAVNSANVVLGGACGAGTYCTNCAAPTPSTIGAGSITANIAGGPVMITTNDNSCGPFGDPGDININSPISYASANSLTFIAARDINTNADVINNGTGAITLTVGRDLTMNANAPVVQSTVIGAKSGTTTVTVGRNLTMLGSNAGGRMTQIGWKTVAGDVITGNVNVTVTGNISMDAGVGNSEATVIGHGLFTAGGAYSTNANITVNAGGNITLVNRNSVRNCSLIGFGDNTSNSVHNGIVSVTAGGNLTLDASAVTLAGGGTMSFIGFHVVGANLSSYSGSVIVNVGGNYTVIPPVAAGATFSTLAIGTSYGGNTFDSVSVTANVGGNITITGSVNSISCRTYIGKWVFVGAPALSGDVTVNCCGTISMTANRSQFCFLGYTALAGSTGTANVAVKAGNIVMNTPVAPVNNVGATIGNANAAATATSGTATVYSAGDISITGQGFCGINARGNVFVQAQGNITANGTVAIRPATIGTALSGATTTILASGNVIGTGNSRFGIGFIVPALPNSLDIEAGGDIQMPTGFSAGSGFITIKADAPIPSFSIPSVYCTFTGAGAAPNALGGLIIPATLNPIFQTTSGNITIFSAPNLTGGGPSNLTIGLVNGNIRIPTTSGNINIGGNPLSGFTTINVQTAVSTTGTIDMSAVGNINATSAISTTTGHLNLTADVDDSGAGNLNITSNISTTGGHILLDAGFGALLGTSAINQTAGLISTTGAGNITAQTVGPILFSGTSPVTVTAASGTISATSTAGTIDIDENITTTAGGSIAISAGDDVNINPVGGTSIAGGLLSVAGGAGSITVSARDNVTVNGDATSITTTTGPITLTADSDNSGFGNLNVMKNITSTTGAICLSAGPGTFGCSQNNCQSGLISGFPTGSCTVNISAGTISSTSGAITITAAEDIIINGASPSITTAGPVAMTAGLGNLTVNQQVRSTGGPITTFAGNDTLLTQTALLPLIHAAGEIRMITGLNLTLEAGTAILSSLPGDQVTLVVDNLHPNQTQPPFPSAISGSLTMKAGSSVTSGSPLRIFTAYSQGFLAGPGVNSIDPTALLNGFSITDPLFGYPTQVFTDTPYEQWCTFFGCPSNYPFPLLGDPFTFFYKICLPQITVQALLVTQQFLLTFDTPNWPYYGNNEYYGWPTKFFLVYALSSRDRAYQNWPPEGYFMSKQNDLLLGPQTDDQRDRPPPEL